MVLGNLSSKLEILPTGSTYIQHYKTDSSLAADILPSFSSWYPNNLTTRFRMGCHYYFLVPYHASLGAG